MWTILFCILNTYVLINNSRVLTFQVDIEFHAMFQINDIVKLLRKLRFIVELTESHFSLSCSKCNFLINFGKAEINLKSTESNTQLFKAFLVFQATFNSN